MTMHELYYKAIAADKEWNAAIEAQVGPYGDPLHLHPSDYSRATRAAHAAKLKAWDAWCDFFGHLEIHDTPAWRAEFCRQIDEELAN